MLTAVVLTAAVAIPLRLVRVEQHRHGELPSVVHHPQVHRLVRRCELGHGAAARQLHAARPCGRGARRAQRSAQRPELAHRSGPAPDARHPARPEPLSSNADPPRLPTAPLGAPGARPAHSHAGAARRARPDALVQGGLSKFVASTAADCQTLVAGIDRQSLRIKELNVCLKARGGVIAPREIAKTPALYAALLAYRTGDIDGANKLKAELTSQAMSADAERYKAQGKVITAEAKGSWLQRSWRPGMMAMFGFIILNNFILVPWAVAFGFTIPHLDIPPQMWSLITVGMGGYIIGHSGEKIVEKWSNKNGR